MTDILTDKMTTVLLGLGSNLEGLEGLSPAQNIVAALRTIGAASVCVVAKSSVYETEPVPPSDQPWYANAVAVASTDLSPTDLLAFLQTIETEFGRVRRTKWESRVLDLDILDYGGQVSTAEALTLPHPHLHERRFVLEPLCEILPAWRHPSLEASAAELLAGLKDGSTVIRR